MQNFKRLLPSFFLVLLALPQVVWLYAFNVSSNYSEAKELYEKLLPIYKVIEPESREASIFSVVIMVLLLVNVIVGTRFLNHSTFKQIAFGNKVFF